MSPCFKSYDVRGKYPSELDESLARKIGWAFADFFSCDRVVVGYDIRNSSPALKDAVIEGLVQSGVEVLDIGFCGTEEVYYATSVSKADGGIMVTASHNPKDYNGMKFVQRDSRPVDGKSGLNAIRALVQDIQGPLKAGQGNVVKRSYRAAYADRLLSMVDISALMALKIVVNAGNGCAGQVVDVLAEHLPFQFVRINHEPDGEFPNGVPNPLLPENRADTAEAVMVHGADFGIAWDGDFDRCFFFDESGVFIEGYYLVGLIAEVLLKSNPGEIIIHDPRLTWNTIETVRRCGGQPVVSPTGHSLIKKAMWDTKALYGGEMSAHHYFRDFFNCDSGMIPWLLVAELVSRTGVKLSEHVAAATKRFPVSGEINRQVADVDTVLRRVRKNYVHEAASIEEIDGVSMDFGAWRFNLRASNTEPVIRLNVETRADKVLLSHKTSELLDLIEGR